MTLVSEIIRRAFREANFIAIGTSPSADEQTEGLEIIQGIVDTIFSITVGTEPKAWYIPVPQKTASVAANYPALPGDPGLLGIHDVSLPPPNVRLLMKNTSPMTVYFQYQPQDGALMEYVDVGHTAAVTLDANGAMFGVTGSDTQIAIEDDLLARNAPRRWVYRMDYGSWVELETLALTDGMPFPRSFDDFFITELAIRLTPRDGNEPRAATVRRNSDMRSYIRNAYFQMAEEWMKTAGGNGVQTYTRGMNPNSFYAG